MKISLPPLCHPDRGPAFQSGSRGDTQTQPLRAKTRWGELLGPTEAKAGPGRGHKTRDRSSQVSDADRKQAERARKLAAFKAKDPQGFEAAR